MKWKAKAHKNAKIITAPPPSPHWPHTHAHTQREIIDLTYFNNMSVHTGVCVGGEGEGGVGDMFSPENNVLVFIIFLPKHTIPTSIHKMCFGTNRYPKLWPQ